jgi:hypothetical protein
VKAVTFHSLRSRQPRPLAESWDDLTAILSVHQQRRRKDTGRLWSPVVYGIEQRSSANVLAVTGLVADLDGVALDRATDALAGVEWLAYTTHSHAPEDERWHLVVPFTRPVAASVWKPTRWGILRHFGIDADPATSDPARIYFLPQHAPGAPYSVQSNRGTLLDPSPFWSTTVPALPGSPRRETDWSPDAAWWDEPQDLSAYAGLSGQALHARLLSEFRHLVAAAG